jgi:glycerol transport system ATP-binding protein
MQLRLESIAKQVGADIHLQPLDLSLVAGSLNVLLGATLAGKTSLMRIMAGLDKPTSGRVIENDIDVTGVSVRKRNLAMVYQQFVNYPSLTVYENIASPLRLQRRNVNDIQRRVGDIAETLRLTPYLNRLPAELSGGQQQRTALARALAKESELLLLDEPLVNLDYKLREELRAELAQLFRNGKTTIVYATTEPQEALQLGGHTALLHEGRLLQFGATRDVFMRPTSLAAARAFSDPPLNIIEPQVFADKKSIAAHSLGIRAYDVRTSKRSENDLSIACQVDLAEISGSDTYLHTTGNRHSIVAQLRGVHRFAIGDACTLYVDPADMYGFAADGSLLFAPQAP